MQDLAYKPAVAAMAQAVLLRRPIGQMYVKAWIAMLHPSVHSTSSAPLVHAFTHSTSCRCAGSCHQGAFNLDFCSITLSGLADEPLLVGAFVNLVLCFDWDC